MSNSYFQFKQFTVNQDRCAMKVSTDACIQGAWTPVAENVKHVLDIGTGTGLLSLMLAQRNPDICIDAIELDKQAAEQAKENVFNSPWADRIHILEGDVRNYPFDKKYDLIICNPPFFQNNLLGPDAARNNARHGLSLSFNELLKTVQNLLHTTGYASVLLPIHEYAHWKSLLEANSMPVFNALFISPFSGADANRTISLFSKKGIRDIVLEDMMHVYESKAVYTKGFSMLLSPFYLYL